MVFNCLIFNLFDFLFGFFGTLSSSVEVCVKSEGSIYRGFSFRKKVEIQQEHG
jgi:hypothetical protein